MKTIDGNTKLTIQLIIAVLVILAGLVLLYLGFYAPPHGEIDESVLVAYGESLTFAGAVLGIDYAAKTVTRRSLDAIRRQLEERKEASRDEE